MCASPNTKRNVSKDYSDLYNTPQEALEALIEVVDFDKSKLYFEPCNGIGKVSNFFKDNLGIQMVTNELHGHSKSDYQEDFLSPNSLAADSWDFDIVVSNPPYKIAAEFVNEGFKYAKEQYHLLRMSFIEGQTRYNKLFSQKHLKNIYVFTYRISCTKGVDEEEGANAVCYAWYHFERDFEGNPTLHWLTK